MNPNLTKLVFILDRSGSMEPLTHETIGGFNSLIEKQKQNGDTFVTTILFDDSYEILHNHVNIRQIPPMTRNTYYARGCTALLDALGRTIQSVGTRLSETPEEERPSKVIITITTDGYENASKNYSLDQIKKMISHQRNCYKWEFVFLGANIDAAENAEALGIPRPMAKTYTASAVGCSSTFHVMDKLFDYMRINSCNNEDYEEDCVNILSKIK